MCVRIFLLAFIVIKSILWYFFAKYQSIILPYYLPTYLSTYLPTCTRPLPPVGFSLQTSASSYARSVALLMDLVRGRGAEETKALVGLPVVWVAG